MKFSNNQYINDKFIDAIIGMEEIPNSGIITDFKVLFDNDTISINSDKMDLKKFCGVPGNRIIKTIPEQSEISLKINEEILHFEFEKNVKYYLNLKNVIRIQMFPNNIWKIQMVEDTYWFVAIPANFKTYFLDTIDA